MQDTPIGYLTVRSTSLAGGGTGWLYAADSYTTPGNALAAKIDCGSDVAGNTAYIDQIAFNTTGVMF
jgi:hypothetical protein